MKSWKKVWRDGLAPQFSTSGLLALRNALVNDDGRLIQGATASPPPSDFTSDSTIESCCALGFGGWQANGLRTVAELEGQFARICLAADEALGEPCASRWFLNWYDDTPRYEMRRELLPEVELAVMQRQTIDSSDYFSECLQTGDEKWAITAA